MLRTRPDTPPRFDDTPAARHAAVLAVVLATALAASPLALPGLPLGADAVTHLYTLVHVDDLVDHGVLFSRWLPWQNGGLGNPRFVFYPWLPYYLAEPWVRLGLSFAAALRVTLAAALMAGAAGCFAWARLRDGTTSGAIGAAAYALSPYLLFATYARASFAEVVALGVAPWAFWTAERWARDPGPRRLATSAGLAGLCVLCHPITGAVVLACWVVVKLAGAASDRRRVGSIVVATALAVGLGATLWLPARAERDAISDVHTTSPGLDYRGNFLPASRLVAWPPGGRLSAGYSVPALGLAVAGLLGAARSRRGARGPLPLAGLVMGLSLLVIPIARPAWEALHTVSRDVQFPHRLLGPASLLLAVLAAAGAEEVLRLARSPRQRRWIAAGLFAGLAVAALPLRHVPRLRAVPPLDARFAAAKDREAGFRGRGYHGDFMPRTTPSLARAWRRAPRPGKRLEPGSLPAGARLLRTRYGPVRYEVVVASPRPWVARWQTLAFPGWRAAIDGRPLATGATADGLLTTAVPAGRHAVTVWFATTPPRRVGNVVTGAALVACAALALWTSIAVRIPRQKRRGTDAA